MVNGPGPVWVERHGALEATDLRLGARDVYQLIERIVTPLGLRVDRTSPVVDARLPDGSRVNVVMPPLAVDGPCITIRRFRARAIELPRAVLAWRRRAARVGGAAAEQHPRERRHGRRQDHAAQRARGSAFPAGERVVTVEDAAELRLPGEHVVRLEARPANADGLGAVTVRSLVRNALRMRPDRIIVGEVRGRRGPRHGPSDEHRPRRLAVDVSCELARRRAAPRWRRWC